jgi:hypothetical protein
MRDAVHGMAEYSSWRRTAHTNTIMLEFGDFGEPKLGVDTVARKIQR